MAVAIHGPSGGLDISGATAAPAQVLSPYKFVGAAGGLETGSVLSKLAATYTPGPSSQQIASGVYLAGAQTIAGDANLVAGNIVAGKTIFGVAGSAAAVSAFATTGATSLMSYSNNVLYISGYDMSNGGCLSIFPSSTLLPNTSLQILSFTLVVPPGDWGHQMWQMVYNSSSGDRALVSNFTMSADQYRCSCEYANTVSQITIPAASGMSLPLSGSGYVRCLITF